MVDKKVMDITPPIAVIISVFSVILIFPPAAIICSTAFFEANEISIFIGIFNSPTFNNLTLPLDLWRILFLNKSSSLIFFGSRLFFSTTWWINLKLIVWIFFENGDLKDSSFRKELSELLELKNIKNQVLEAEVEIEREKKYVLVRLNKISNDLIKLFKKELRLQATSEDEYQQILNELNL